MTTTIAAPAGVQHRFLPAAFEVEAGADGRITAALSSELAVRTPWGDETLVHTRDAVNLGRASMGLPLLIDHDHTRQLGRVVNIRIENRRLMGDLVFSERAEVAGIRADVLAGLRPDLSIGYQIDEIENGPDAGAYRATRWTLIEVSSVLVPADHSVGVGRSLSERNSIMNTTTTEPATGAQDVSAERARILDIQEMGRRLSIEPTLVEQAINEGWSRDQLAERRAVSRPAVAIHTGDNLDRRDDFNRAREQFSLANAIRDLSVPGGQLTGREAEVSQELSRINGRAAKNGVYVPLGVLSERTQLVGTAGIGGNLVGQELRDQDFIAPLRRRSAIMQTGSTVLGDLVGDAILPRQTNAVTGEWIAEDASGSETDLTFDQIIMKPKTVTGRISWSRQMALQATPAIETLARQDLSEQLALALDLAAITGTGASNQPRGILNTSGIGAVLLGTNGAVPNFDNLVELESAVANANADMGAMAYLTNSRMRGRLKRSVRFGAGTDSPLWGDDNRVNGYAAYVSNNVPSNLTKGSGTDLSAMIFGNWQDLLIGLWGSLDLLVDPYTFSNQGRVRITAFMSADIAVRRAASFAAITDAITV
jgi:HK97 family phage major capsid protein